MIKALGLSFASGGQRFASALVGIKDLVGDQQIGVHLRQQRVCPDQIMRLPSVSGKAEGLPSAATKAWIFVLNLPRLWPIA